MAIDFFGIFKGLKIQKETDRSKQLILQVGASATTGTATTLEVNQTANRTVTLPDASGALITASSVDVLTNKSIDGDNNTLSDIPLSAIKTVIGNANTFVVRDGAGALASVNYTQATALLNSMVGDSGSGGLKGLVPAPVIGDATKFLRGDGTFQTITAGTGDVVGPGSATDNAVTRFDGTTGKLIQNSSVTISDAAIMAGATLNNTNSITVLDSNLIIQDNADNTKQVQIQASSVGTGTTAVLTVPPATTTLVGTTSAQALTNKDVDGGSASNANRITLPQNTTVALAALTRKEATIAYDTTLNQVVYDDGSNFQPIGAGSTPTGDANSIAFFDNLGNLNSDDTDLTYVQFDGVTSNPSGIHYGTLDSGATLTSTNHGLAIATADNASLSLEEYSIIAGSANTGGSLFAQNTSIVNGSIQGPSSVIQATAGSHAHGSGQGNQAIIIADNQSHAFGNVIATADARIQAFGQSLAFGNVTTDFVIEAQSASLAGGQTGAGGGVHAGIASVAFGEDINEGNLVNTQFTYQFGQGHQSQAPHVSAFGRYSVDVAGDGSTWVDTDPLFILGNGASSGSPANAWQVDKDGREIATASQVKTAIRLVAAASAIDARTDYKIICDTNGASGNLTLPPGEDGLEYILTGAGAGIATYTVVPNGIETLDASVISSVATTVVSRIYFFNGVWYGM